MTDSHVFLGRVTVETEYEEPVQIPIAITLKTAVETSPWLLDRAALALFRFIATTKMEMRENNNV